MQIRVWQKVVFFSSIAIFIAYYQKERLKKGYMYIKEKFGDLIDAFASKWVGVNEIGNNQAFGNDVFQQMMKKVGWSSSDQWCMYFAKAVHYEIFENERNAINKILVGNSQSSFNNAKNDKTGTYQAITQGTPKKGDIFIFQHTDRPATGHAGIVSSVSSDGKTMNTIEGNTSDKSIADGDTIARKVRPAIIGTNIKGSTLRLRGFIRKIEK
jgi:hypothetical protein